MRNERSTISRREVLRAMAWGTAALAAPALATVRRRTHRVLRRAPPPDRLAALHVGQRPFATTSTAASRSSLASATAWSSPRTGTGTMPESSRPPRSATGSSAPASTSPHRRARQARPSRATCRASIADVHEVGATDVVLSMFPVPDRIGGQRAGESFQAYVARLVPQLTADDWRRTAGHAQREGRDASGRGPSARVSQPQLGIRTGRRHDGPGHPAERNVAGGRGVPARHRLGRRRGPRRRGVAAQERAPIPAHAHEGHPREHEAELRRTAGSRGGRQRHARLGVTAAGRVRVRHPQVLRGAGTAVHDGSLRLGDEELSPPGRAFRTSSTGSTRI